MNKKILTVIGARPQFIKAATLSRSLLRNTNIQEVILHTGQHYDPKMSDIFFEELKIPKPAYFSNIHGGSHGQMTGRMLESIENVMYEEKPNAVLVYGDTNSTLAGALAASKLHIPVIHVESGLRSYNKLMPEEINRLLTDHMSDVLFCPTKGSVLNLKNEGINNGIYHLGDIMYDSALYAIKKNKENKLLSDKFNYLPNQIALMTIHRADSTNYLSLFKELLDYSINFSVENNLKIVFPIHPRTQKMVNALTDNFKKNIILIEPLSYFETQYLITKSKYIITDSGGLQKEAYFHRVPCITLRTETEWAETIEAGWNRLWTVTHYNERKEITDYGIGNSAIEMVKVMDGLL